ncbi:MAG: diphthine--ammonia ligase [Candidatus Micrarchaeota archaeon]|nr:diphthine--ammonia ligase [Candidatus Micrarchaeota archaeon]MCX8154243.1 diphthine--ammonia ligase [Candidatus Micrarchaeota archaeon]
MKLAALYSGGKDSHLAVSIYRDKIEYLINIIPKSRFPYMYHPINLELVKTHAENMGISLLRFHQESDNELEALERAMSEVKDLGCDGIVTGAIGSKYQFSRIQRIASRLDLEVYSPLWQIDLDRYFELYDRYRVKALIVGVYAYPLDKKYLLREFNRELADELVNHSINPFGEGGEFESFVVESSIMTRVDYRVDRIEGKLNSWTAYLV